uniref:HzV124like-4 n=1 Tax=Chelonus inanitus TaxID=49201 RepID=D7FBA5_9HYME|nr:HzV124like-4 [Chelonus inanitus]
MSAVGNKIRSALRNVTITPECDSMSSSLQFSAMISLGLTLIFAIACAGLYVYVHLILKEDTTDNKDKKNNLMVYAFWGSTAYIAFNTLISIWLYMTANGLTECIKPSA